MRGSARRAPRRDLGAPVSRLPSPDLPLPDESEVRSLMNAGDGGEPGAFPASAESGGLHHAQVSGRWPAPSHRLPRASLSFGWPM